ncbi:hypothetical protein [Turneriella parva]|uniref:Uncharacterized protein n=1 Tax=Turneriella parva (strain ATCC BAA-1111 / DSM 21527 / NCTC 11395 / H) TaxID=869212 RepID=I4B162_TURPD|nr:hypothetical protein [Turneriella parva]AFM11019.1 hypothetical protein Turpa_0363 [Turneriella parva DSM 21527]
MVRLRSPQVRLLTRLRSSIFAIALLPVLIACIGRATPPEQVKLTQAQNEVLGKFARRVGEAELNILLRNPNDTTLPGIPVGDLLYILAKVNEDKLITLVKGIGATYTLELILAIKRVGCTRANTVPVASGYGFDARSVANLNGCTWQHFHVPNLMVQLLNGVSNRGLQVLIDGIRHNYPEYGLPANQALQVSCAIATCPTLHVAPYLVTVEHYRYLMKLAYVVAAFDTPTLTDANLSSEALTGPRKLYDLLNLTYDGRDMVFLLDSFDRNACPVGGQVNSNCVYVDAANVLTTYDGTGDLWTDIAVNTYQLQGLQNLLAILRDVQDTSKMGVLINGRRTQNPASLAIRLAEDEAQIRYFTDRLTVVIEHRGGVGPYCPAGGPYAPFIVDTSLAVAEQDKQCNFQNFTAPQGGSTEWNSKLVGTINDVTNVNRMMDLIYQIDDGFDSATHIATATFPNRGIDNLMVLLNNINPNAVHPGPSTNNELRTASYLIDNVAPDPGNNIIAKRNRISYLVQYLGTTYDVLKMACYNAVAEGGTAGMSCFKRGLVNQVASGSKTDDAALPDLSAAGQKLSNLIGFISEIEDMRFLINKVDMTQLRDIIAGLLINSTQNTALLVNQITGNDCWATPTNSAGAALPLSGVTGAAITPGLGTAYSGQTTVTIPGGGTGRALVDASGRIGAIVILSEGSGLALGSTPAITITDAGGGTGSTATAITGRCVYNPPNDFRGFPTATSTGATGLGKMVNVINHITGSPGTIVTLINGVTDGDKLGALINGVTRSSNLVGVVNGTVDASRNNNASINDLINLLNSLAREDVYKMVHLMENLGDAREVDALVTVPSIDHDMIAQLMAPYNSAAINTSSGIGVAALTELVAQLRYNGGNAVTAGAVAIAGGGGAGATATFGTTTANQVSAIELTSYGAGCTSAPTVNIAGVGTGAAATAIFDSSAQQVSRIRIDNAGSGYTVAPAVSFTGGCTTQPVAAARVNRIGAVTVTNAGSGYAANPTCTASGVNVTCQASGSIAAPPGGLSSFYGGSGYTTGDVCPISGAGGSGATCTVTATGGALTGCSIIGNEVGYPAGGINYGHGRIVKIGGRAEAVATITGGVVTGVTITNAGCGYPNFPLPAPVVEVVGCTGAALTATVTAGRITAISGFPTGTGCPVGAKVVIGENPFVSHADGASAIVNQLVNGRLTFVSVSEPSVNAAQLIQLIDRDATGITSTAGVTRGYSITYNGATPNISAREAMVRLLHHGVTIPAASSKGYFSENFGLGSVVDIASDGLTDNLKSGVALGGAGIWTNAYAVNLPGLGPQHIAGSILNNLSGVAPTQTLINMVNTNTIDLTDTLLLLGCGDRSTYSNLTASPFSWQQICAQIGPGLW